MNSDFATSSAYLLTNDSVPVEESKKSPSENVSKVSYVLFSWVNPLIKLGKKKPLEQVDMPVSPKNLMAKDSCERFLEAWEDRIRKKKKPSVFKALATAFWKEHALVGLLTFTEAMLNILSGVVFNLFLENIEKRGDEMERYYLVSGLILLMFSLATIHHHVFYHNNLFGMLAKNAVTAALYKKSLKLRIGQQSSTGKLVNLMSNDVQKFEDCGRFVQYLYISPIQTLICFGYLMHLLGWQSAVAGMAVLLSVIPIQGMLSKKLSNLRTRIIGHRDTRIRYLSDVLNGIQILKCYAWHYAFKDHIMNVRNKEMKATISSGLITSFNDSFYAWSSALLVFCVCGTRFYIGEPIEAAVLFPSIALFNIIKLTMCLFFPIAVQFTAEAAVSAKRVEEILLQEEVKKDLKQIECLETEDVAISMDDATFTWNEDTLCLEDIKMELKKGELCAIIGKFGSGKSSLLLSLMNELTRVKGDVKVNGKISYASQQPWILPATIKDNILFGREYNEERFKQVLKASALESDIKLFSQGVDTMLGERGYNVSGGQKARISLARALYDEEADIFLLDDVLSALDNKVGNQVFHKVKELLQGKTCLIVSHQLHIARFCDKLMVLDNGRQEYFGSYNDLMNSENKLSDILKKFDAKEEQVKEEKKEDKGVEEKPQLSEDAIEVISGEDRQVGSISFSTYKSFFKKCGGYLICFFIMFLMVAGQVAIITTDKWLSNWAEIKDKDKQLDMKHFYTYLIRTVIIILLCTTRALTFYYAVIMAAAKIFSEMLSSILRAPMSFFQTNPQGRILNRFTKDQSFVEETLPWTLFDVIQCICIDVGIIAITAMTFPMALLTLIPIVWISIYYRNAYVASSREIKRLDAISRSPIYSFLSTSLSGLATIRTMKKEEEFNQAFYFKQDQNTNCNFAFQMVSRWLGIRLDLAASFLFTAAAVMSILLIDSMDAGSIGLGLAYMMELINLIQWTVRQISEVENLMTSVERTITYTELESEASEENSISIPSDWPSKGKIEFNNLTLRYPSNPNPILSNISCLINSGEKVGLVGRTGAGKSSLMTTLFRLVETDENSILIDDIPISKVGLMKLRSSISIIPQDRSLRFNLNPFNEFTDEDIWKALEIVGLKNSVQKLSEKLETEIQENGANFSVGERQLFCLVRALLRNSNILLMDEATASIDPATTECIQKCIQEQFKHATVLTIAHRLPTIMDYDRVLVLEKGQLVEADHPFNLLSKDTGYFKDLVKALGPEGEKSMLAIAKESFLNKKV
ncbi:ABC transporter domain-containing protein [Rozella allomycis CSF55]|uniref:ABC transporter domain-containing protein n=1 Tax=Rozella allomycis (strain CSF55) TaxID=988480 RepID=A0A075AZH7_ROZAC|nr:ABC transporter domain-containing protein [Rozella allomycis CSF55]|eukprot:EPZ35647.1 ABC transporter domain-containing protein [Rozella allomycis CSF55]